MICEKCLKRELKKCPVFIREARKSQDLGEWIDAKRYQEILEWVLSDDACGR